MTGPEGLIVFQGAESLQVRAALRAAERPIRNKYTYTQALTCAKDTVKTWMEGQGRDHSGAVTHARERHRVPVSVAISGRMRGGLSLEAGAGHPQQAPYVPDTVSTQAYS